MSKLIEPKYIGDGIYFIDNGCDVHIAVNSAKNVVAYLDSQDVDKAIEYLRQVQHRMNQNWLTKN